jgi:hypothetical protein
LHSRHYTDHCWTHNWSWCLLFTVGMYVRLTVMSVIYSWYAHATHCDVCYLQLVCTCNSLWCLLITVGMHMRLTVMSVIYSWYVHATHCDAF